MCVRIWVWGRDVEQIACKSLLHVAHSSTDGKMSKAALQLLRSPPTAFLALFSSHGSQRVCVCVCVCVCGRGGCTQHTMIFFFLGCSTYSTRAPPWTAFEVWGRDTFLCFAPALNMSPSPASSPDRKTSRIALLFLRSFLSTAFLALFLSRGSQRVCVCVWAPPAIIVEEVVEAMPPLSAMRMTGGSWRGRGWGGANRHAGQTTGCGTGRNLVALWFTPGFCIPRSQHPFVAGNSLLWTGMHSWRRSRSKWQH